MSHDENRARCDVELVVNQDGGACDVRAVERPLPLRPVSCEPGTPAKIEAMRRRNAAGEALYHPDDMPLDASEEDGRAVARARNGTLIMFGLVSLLCASRRGTCKDGRVSVSGRKGLIGLLPHQKLALRRRAEAGDIPA